MTEVRARHKNPPSQVMRGEVEGATPLDPLAHLQDPPPACRQADLEAPASDRAEPSRTKTPDSCDGPPLSPPPSHRPRPT